MIYDERRDMTPMQRIMDDIRLQALVQEQREIEWKNRMRKEYEEIGEFFVEFFRKYPHILKLYNVDLKQ